MSDEKKTTTPATASAPPVETTRATPEQLAGMGAGTPPQATAPTAPQVKPG